MELVDLYNDRHEPTGLVSDKHSVPKGYFRVSVHVWIIDKNGNLLLQQRVSAFHKFPNMWANISGVVAAGETPIAAAIREIKEELGLSISKDELKYIATYKRLIDYAEVYLIEKNINLKELTLGPKEVNAVKYVTQNEFREMIKKGEGVKSSFAYFENYFYEMNREVKL